MRNSLKTLVVGILLALPTLALAVQVSVPSAPGGGYYLVSTSTGNYVATTTVNGFSTTSANAYINASSTILHPATGTNGFILSLVNGVANWVASTTLSTISGLLNLATQVTGTLGVGNGGTGQISFKQGWLGINDSGTFIASTSPTFAWITATSTATSTFTGGVNLSGTDCFAQAGTCLQTFIQNATAYKQAVNYATATILPGTPSYSNGSSGVGATLTEVGFGALVVDGQTVTLGQRILVKNQADFTTNGIYTVTTVGSGIASYLLTRATDYNTSLDIYAGTTAPVLAGGTANGDTQWTESTTGTITIGSSNIVFIETSYGTSGTVTSVAQTVPAFLSVAGSPITTSGTLAITLSGTALPLANGGTGTTTQILNGINFYDGTNISTQADFEFSTSSQVLGIDRNFAHGTASFQASGGRAVFGYNGSNAFLDAGAAGKGIVLTVNGDSLPTVTVAPAASVAVVVQAQSGVYTDVQALSPTGAVSPESNFTALIHPNVGGNRWVDWDNNNAANADFVSATEGVSSGAALVPFTIQFCDTDASKCEQHYIAMPGGTNAFGIAGTSSVDLTTSFQIASNTAATLFEVDTFAGNHIFTIGRGGATTSGTFAATGSSTIGGTFSATHGATFGNFTGLLATTTAATTTSFAISSINTGLLLKTTTGGAIVAAVADTDYATPSLLAGNTFRDWNVVSGYLTPTTTLGILVSASSTIGAGGQTTGLTISGGATTTLNGYFASKVLIGTATTSSDLNIATTISAYNANSTLNTRSNNVATTFNFECPEVTNQTCVYRLFRSTNTSGTVALDIMQGTNANNINSRLLGGSSGTTYFNALGGNVGIASTTAYARLSIQANNGDTNTTLFAIGSSTQTGTSTLLVVKSNGNVGLGTTTPFAQFSIFAASSTTAGFQNLMLFAIGSTTVGGAATSTLFSVSNTGLASTTNLIISGTGTGATKCLQVAADGTVSAASAACGTGSGITSLTNGGGLDFSVSPITTTGTITAQLGTGTIPVAGRLAAFMGPIGTPTNVYDIATATLTCSGVVTCTASTIVGTASAVTVTGGANGQILGWSSGAPTWLATTTFSGGLTFSAGNVTLANLNANSVLGCIGAACAPTSLATSSIFTGTVGQNAMFTGTGLLIGTSSLIVDVTQRVGVGTTSPFALFSINPNGLVAGIPAFVIGSSTKTTFQVSSNGNINGCETKYGTTGNPATSTAMLINWQNTCNTINIDVGSAAVTITHVNATTSTFAGTRKLVEVCNPPVLSAGAITWVGVEWVGIPPSQTTTANQCDEYTFWISAATSTVAAPAWKVHGNINTGFQ